MNKKILTLSIILSLTLTLSPLIHSIPLAEAANPATFKTIGVVPSKLTVYLSPAVIPNDTGTHYVVFVQLQDAAGNPGFAPADGVGVSLSSSNTTVGTVNPAVTIAAGTHFVRTWFKSTTTIFHYDMRHV